MALPQAQNSHISGVPSLFEQDDEALPEVLGGNIITEEQDDGSVVVRSDEFKGPQQAPNHYENLAGKIDSGALARIAITYLDLIDKDAKARSKRDEQYKEGIQRSGLGGDAPGGAQFTGASKVVHPVIAEACIDYEAGVIKELLPPDGPVRTQIIGQDDDEVVEARAERKKDWLNWQLTDQIEEFFDEMEQLHSQLPLGGSQYLKLWYDPTLRRPRVEFLPIDNVYLPYAAVNFYTASRVTEVNDITEDTFQERVESDLYLDIDSHAPATEPDQSESEEATDKVEGRERTAYNEDGIRRVYHCYTWLKVEDDPLTKGRRAPYILMIDEPSMHIVGMYRNWEEGDDRLKKLDWIVEWRFIPWRGAYGIGIPHIIGGLAIAATGALRALLDSAHINNTPSAMKIKGAHFSGQSKSADPTEIVELEGPAGIDDIRKLAMPFPFNPPSPVLFQLLGWLTTAAKGVVTTAEEKIADVNQNAPVGTTQALIEQGAKVMSTIHSRQHKSMKRVLAILGRINRWWLNDMERGDTVAELDIRPEDWKRSTDVVPVSDPNIFCETQRYAQTQTLMVLSEKNPDLYDRKAVQRRVLEQIKLPNINEVLPDAATCEEMNPALENVAMSLGKPVGAFPDQDHLAHIQMHLAYAQDPVLGANPIIGPKFTPGLVEHLKQHLTLWYLGQVDGYVSGAMKRPVGTHKVKSIFKDMQALYATASKLVHQDTAKVFQGAMPVIQNIAQMLAQQAQQAQQQAQADPGADAMLKASLAETQRRAARDKGDLSLGMQKVAAEVAENAADNQTKLQIAQSDLAVDAQKLDQEEAATVIQAQQVAREHLMEMSHGQPDAGNEAKLQADRPNQSGSGVQGGRGSPGRPEKPSSEGKGAS